MKFARRTALGVAAATAVTAFGGSVAPLGYSANGIPDRTGATRLTVTHALREEQFLLYPPVEVCSVTVGGRPLPGVRPAGLPAHGSAWTRYRRGVLVKVTGLPGTLALRALPCSRRP